MAASPMLLTANGLNIRSTLRKSYPRTSSKAASRSSMRLRQLLGLLAVASLSFVFATDPAQGDGPIVWARDVGLYIDDSADAILYDESTFTAEKASYLPLRYDLPPTTASVVQERHNRVRGKDTQTSLKSIQAPMRHESKSERAEHEKRLRAVRRGFEHALQGYRRYAWGP